MKRWTIGLALMLVFASFAAAQGPPTAPKECSITFSSETFLEGKRQYAGSNTWDNLSAEEMQFLGSKATKLLDLLYAEDKKGGGEWSMTLKSTTTCSDGTTTNTPPLQYTGITARGEARIARASVKMLHELTAVAEDSAAKGHKHAWGKKAKEKEKK